MAAGTKIATLEQILATRVKVMWPYRINLHQASAADLDAMYEWCTAHTAGKWRVSTEFADYFQFQEDQDAVMFMLKYGGSRVVTNPI